MRKTQFEIIAAVIAVALFVSCSPAADIAGSREPSPQASPTDALLLVPTQKNTQTVSSLPDTIPGGIEVVFWHPWSGKMANLVEEMVEEFNETNQWDITIQSSAFSDEQVLMRQVAGVLEMGDPMPDLIAAPDFFLASMIDNGVVFRDLEEYVNSPDWGIPQADLERFFPVFLDSGLLAGERISFPAYRSANFLFYNKTWAEELGFPQAPIYPEDFKAQTCEASVFNLTDSTKIDGTGGWIYTYDPNSFISWLKAFNGGIIFASQNQGPFLQNGNIDSSVFLFNLYSAINNCIWKAIEPLPYQYFTDRLAISYSGNMEDILIQEQVNDLNDVQDKWTIIPYPSISGRPVLTVSGVSYSITSSNDDKSLAAWEFIKWMTTTENQVKIVETTATFPLSATALDALAEFRAAHPAWSDSLVYLPFAESIPTSTEWIFARDILSDISWQLIQFTTSREDIPLIWENAETLLQEMVVN